MAVYELFPFFNEVDLLELHLMEMNPVVDYWVICELPKTFTGLDKPLYLQKALMEGRLDAWRGKIRVIRPGSIPEGPHPTVDWFQRRQLVRGLGDAKPDDIVILTDLDEIPNRDKVSTAIAEGLDYPKTMVCRLYYYTLDWFDPIPWPGPIITPREFVKDTQELRDLRGCFPMISDGGWHFSWLGTEEQIIEKLKAVDIERENAIYGHDNIVAPPLDREFISKCRNLGQDLFSREHRKKTLVQLDSGTTHPHEVHEWINKYPSYKTFGVQECSN